MISSRYLLAGQVCEVDRLKLQSWVWGPSGRRLLEQFGDSRGVRAVDLGCAAMGWLRLLRMGWSRRRGRGTDIDEAMLAAAEKLLAEQRLDLFESKLEPSSFDLARSRSEISPLARGDEQMAGYCRIARPGGIVALEDWGQGLVALQRAGARARPARRADRSGFRLGLKARRWLYPP